MDPIEVIPRGHIGRRTIIIGIHQCSIIITVVSKAKRMTNLMVDNFAHFLKIIDRRIAHIDSDYHIFPVVITGYYIVTIIINGFPCILLCTIIYHDNTDISTLLSILTYRRNKPKVNPSIIIFRVYMPVPVSNCLTGRILKWGILLQIIAPSVKAAKKPSP